MTPVSAEDLVRRAIAAGVRIATAESCTGGMVAAAITAVPGASAVFDAGFVTYSNTAKQKMLGVRAATLEAFGAVSPEVAREMAKGALARASAVLAVSVTGIAGPGGSDFKPEGRVCFALAMTGLAPEAQIIEFGAIGRDRLRRAARDHALGMLTEGVLSCAP